MGIGKLGAIVAFLGELWEAARFGVQLGLSCRAVRMQFFELLRRDAPRPTARIGVAANVLDGAAGRQAVFVTMESAPRPNPGLWMRVDIFGREGYRQTFYPFWRDAEVFHDFLAACAEIAEAPARPGPAEGDTKVEEASIDDAKYLDAQFEDARVEDPDLRDDPVPPALTVDSEVLKPKPVPAGLPPRRVIGRPRGLRGLLSWFAQRLRPASPPLGRPYRSRQAGSAMPPGRAAGGRRRRWTPEEGMEPETLAIQTTARQGEAQQGHCTLMAFADLPAVLDHVLLSGNRVAIRVASEGPDQWAVIWRRADGGLYLRWGGLEHPAGPIYRESPRTLYQKLAEYDLDLARVWSQSRPSGV